MAHDEYIRTAVKLGKTYDDLPPRVKAILPLAEWKTKVKDLCIQAGVRWSSSVVRTVCGEQEYYDELVRCYKAWGRLYPYHLADYVARVMRLTPFRYYSDVLFNALRDEHSYDSIPNFTAADIVAVTGVGRNEYIAIMNACKAKRLMWRVNKALARELLPQVPCPVRMEPWWHVAVVNVGESEYRELSRPEAQLLHTACDTMSGMAVCVAQFDPSLLQLLLRKGLLYLEVPVSPDDRFTIPPLEGFVSNRTSDIADAGVDPLEALLYSVFVANSARLRVKELAGILGVELLQLKVALAIACRLGFATRGEPEGAGASSLSSAPSRALSLGPAFAVLGVDEDAAGASGGGGPGLGGIDEDEGGGAGDMQGDAVAVVVDAEATSYLMMGALSPGLKRHSVTLFEGGRVSGEAVISELITELWASHEAGAGFEGDMLRLTHYAAALATLLQAARDAAPGAPLELLRKESLAGLEPAAAAKVLTHAYAAVLPITPLPSPPLPLDPFRPDCPAYYGPTAEADSPWLHLVLYSTARAGPLSLVLMAGTRLWRLPPQLDGCTHALVWAWDAPPKSVVEGRPALVEGMFLLHTLNEVLSRTALMVQPLVYSSMVTTAEADEEPESAAPDLVEVVDVALPLQYSSDAAGAGAAAVQGVEGGSRQHRSLVLPRGVLEALQQLGLLNGVGFLQAIRTPSPSLQGADSGWVPLAVQFGVPLHCLQLCRDVCAAARANRFLEQGSRAKHQAGLQRLQQHLMTLISQYGAVPMAGHAPAQAAGLVELPQGHLLFDGTSLHVVDISDCTQGSGCMVLDL